MGFFCEILDELRNPSKIHFLWLKVEGILKYQRKLFLVADIESKVIKEINKFNLQEIL